MSGRYDGATEHTQLRAGGRTVRYLAPRILPRGAPPDAPATTVADSEVDRIDLVAQRTLRDAAQWWQIADANEAIDPLELCRDRGATLRLPGGTP